MSFLQSALHSARIFKAQASVADNATTHNRQVIVKTCLEFSSMQGRDNWRTGAGAPLYGNLQKTLKIFLLHCGAIA